MTSKSRAFTWGRSPIALAPTLAILVAFTACGPDKPTQAPDPARADANKPADASPPPDLAPASDPIDSGAIADSADGSTTGDAADGAADALDGAADGGALAPFMSGVPGTRALTSLTQTEREMLCAATSKYLGEALTDPRLDDARCRLDGNLYASLLPKTASDGELRAACQQAYDACTQPSAPGDAAPAPDSLDPDRIMPMQACTIPPTCAATVAEAEACLTEQAAILTKSITGAAPCAELTRATLTSFETPPPSSPACMTYQAKCPGANI